MCDKIIAVGIVVAVVVDDADAVDGIGGDGGSGGGDGGGDSAYVTICRKWASGIGPLKRRVNTFSRIFIGTGIL